MAWREEEGGDRARGRSWHGVKKKAVIERRDAIGEDGKCVEREAAQNTLKNERTNIGRKNLSAKELALEIGGCAH